MKIENYVVRCKYLVTGKSLRDSMCHSAVVWHLEYPLSMCAAGLKISVYRGNSADSFGFIRSMSEFWFTESAPVLWDTYESSTSFQAMDNNARTGEWSLPLCGVSNGMFGDEVPTPCAPREMDVFKRHHDSCSLRGCSAFDFHKWS